MIDVVNAKFNEKLLGLTPANANKRKALSYLISTPAPLAGAISNQELTNTDHSGTPAPIAGAKGNQGEDNTFTAKKSIHKNIFSNNGGNHAQC